jgi:phosphohistidine phosphatase SixA
MLVVCITHAEARDPEEHVFRGLTESGREQTKGAATRLRELLPDIAPALGDKPLTIEKVVSSPKARCVETVLLLAKQLSEFITTNEIHISDRLKFGKMKEPRNLVDEVSEAKVEAMIVGTHASLACALPRSAKLPPDKLDEEGCFEQRPVLVVIDREPGMPWESAQVLYCEGYSGSSWENLLGA